ncbi:MAG TPA: alpha-2-macroglobulin family protein [Xanthomonadaceae bacterium]|jgi:uncharacterized protein YfaS (alpha-2-macroglobulin family)
MRTASLLSLALLLLAASTASAAPPVIAHGAVRDGKLDLTFDQPMLTWNEARSLDAIRIEPAVACDWHWNDDVTLECDTPTRDDLFHKASAYRLVVGRGLMSQSGEEVQPREMVVETPRPAIQANAFEWTHGVPEITIGTNQKVTSDALARAITVDFEGRAVRFAVAIAQGSRHNYSDVDTYQLELRDFPARQGVLRVRIHPGLRGSEGPLPGTQDKVLLTALVDEPFAFRGIRCREDYGQLSKPPSPKPNTDIECIPEDTIALSFSRPPSDAAIAALAAQLPAGWSVLDDRSPAYDWMAPKSFLRAPTAMVYLQSKRPGTRLRLELPASLTSSDGLRLGTAVRLSLRVGDLHPSATAKPGVLLTPAGSGALPVLETVNKKDLPVERFAIGERSLVLPLTGITISTPVNKTGSAPAPASPDAIREHGGVVLGGTAMDPDAGFAIVYAPFNVLVSSGDDQLLVWASSWGDSRGLAAARAELLSIASDGTAKVMAEATTDDGGVALLPKPASLEDRDSPLTLYVRVTAGDRRTVTPVLSNLDTLSTQNGDYHDRYGQWQNGAQRTFGVSDRPLYRPGDFADYRVWRRQRAHNRLMLAGKDDVTLGLRSVSRSKLLQSWPAHLDAMGSVAGRIHLPDLLPDDTYCIGIEGGAVVNRWERHTQGACFQVARFEVQTLYAQMKADRAAAMGGQDVRLELEAGYYSGDAAADIPVHFESVLNPQRFEQAYPKFSAFTFIDPVDPESGDESADPLDGLQTPERTDGKGKSAYDLHLPAELKTQSASPIRFGEISFDAEVTIPGKAASASTAATVLYAAYPRYVGLKSQDWWLPLDRDPELEAVVAGFDGQALAGQAVEVDIVAVDAPAGTKPVAHCSLRSGQPSACPFHPAKPGYYRFEASAPGAAPTKLTRYFARTALDIPEKNAAAASLTLLQASDGVHPARVKLHMPFAKATVLFTIEYDHVLRHWVQAVGAADSEIEVPVEQAWAPGVSVHALIRASDPAAKDGGFGARTLDALLDLDIPRLHDDRIAATLDQQRVAPGHDIVLHLANPSSGPHHATISVVDDSVYQQATSMHGFADPSAAAWLGSLKTWNLDVWYGLEAWKEAPNLFYRGVGPPVITDVAAPMAAAPAAGRARAKYLDTIQVTGSRVRRVDQETASPAILLTRHSESTVAAGAAIRSDFPDVAYWNADVALAAGESRDLRIHLPDNLTRWRVLVWSSDAGDGFAQTQATVETSLPVELRIGAPGRLYVGDRSGADVSARNHGEQAATVSLQVHADGAGVSVDANANGSVQGNAELSKSIALAPTTAGDIAIVARAAKNGGGDATASTIPVLSTMGSERVSQTGWIDAAALNLPLPVLPEGASALRLDVKVDRGLGSWSDGWLRDLRDYPHRCWEQTLSRAIGAALAVESGGDATQWPDAKTVVQDAIAVAPMFQSDDGLFQYFTGSNDASRHAGNAALSAYTLRGFHLLHSLGYGPPTEAQASLETRLASVLAEAAKQKPDATADRFDWETHALVAGALAAPSSLDAKALANLWKTWPKLSWYGRSELVRALVRKPQFAEQARTGIERLRAAGEQRGLRRVIHDPRDFAWVLGSDLRDQCGVVAALYELDKSADGEPARRSLLRGLQDLYAGGTQSLDTQASAQCLMALQVATKNLPVDAREQQVLASLGGATQTLQVSPRQAQAEWSPVVSDATATLRLQAQGATSATVSYNAELRYALDLRLARPHAVGMRLARSYQVLRNGAWVELGKAALHEGDWVRVRLVLEVPALRHFVAITDVVPGGLVSRDLALSHVGGADVKQLGQLGSWWFDSRQTGQNDVKLYAEQLPPGTHEVFYYAQAVQPGDYFAPPAIAELMYGRASRSTTTPEQVVILPAPAANR